MTIDEAISHALEVAEQQEFLSTQNHGYCDEKRNVEAREQCAECAAEHRQLAEWLKELKEAKRLLKMAVSIINNSFPEVGSCWGCANHDEVNDECKGGAFAECADVCKWQYADEALKLIGEDDNESQN